MWWRVTNEGLRIENAEKENAETRDAVTA